MRTQRFPVESRELWGNEHRCGDTLIKARAAFELEERRGVRAAHGKFWQNIPENKGKGEKIKENKREEKKRGAGYRFSCCGRQKEAPVSSLGMCRRAQQSTRNSGRVDHKYPEIRPRRGRLAVAGRAFQSRLKRQRDACGLLRFRS